MDDPVLSQESVVMRIITGTNDEEMKNAFLKLTDPSVEDIMKVIQTIESARNIEISCENITTESIVTDILTDVLTDVVTYKKQPKVLETTIHIPQ